MTTTQQQVSAPFTAECIHGTYRHQTVAGFLECHGGRWIRDERRELEFPEWRSDGVKWCARGFSLYIDVQDARQGFRMHRAHGGTSMSGTDVSIPLSEIGARANRCQSRVTGRCSSVTQSSVFSE
ncbi:hypothetical protein DEU38_10121 [Rhodococcus sp. AG1013]|nr:hypothetical protein DEU38_10121 [Rhodococcus sp. AG1013]